jgi:serine protease Do
MMRSNNIGHVGIYPSDNWLCKLEGFSQGENTQGGIKIMAIRNNKRSFLKKAWLPIFLLVVSGLLFGGTIYTTADAAGQKSFWQERPQSTAPILPQGFSPLPSLANLVKQLKPAVVNIYSTQVIKPKKRHRQRRQMPRHPFFDDFFGGMDPFEHFFQDMPQREFKRNSLGSGFIISPEGYVITNYHVVADASEIKVLLADERSFTAKVIGGDQKTDIALLKIEPKGKLPAVYLGDSDKLQVGDWAIAIGNPFGLGHTVTTGIISGKAREIGQGPYDDFLQTDASINPGNSGGPLFDTAGNVIGINTAIIAGGSGIGFAVPINLAKSLLPQLQEKGKVTRGWLGVGIQNLTDELAENFGVKKDKGVLLSQVFADSPADKAGLKAGDIVVEVNGKRVTEVRQLTNEIAAIAPGQETKIEVLRDGKLKSFSIKLGERERGESLARLGPSREEAEEKTSLGLSLAPLTPERARRIGVEENLRGLVVVQVDPAGPTSGFVRPGDVILEVNRKRISSVRGFNKALKKSGKKSNVLLRIQRGNSQLFIVVKK